jgi:hypothetical protein
MLSRGATNHDAIKRETVTLRLNESLPGGTVLAALLLVASATVAVAAPATPSPCSLLSADDVAAVIGPLAVPPFPSDGYDPVADGDRCRYVAKDLRSILVAVQWKGGADDMRAIAWAQRLVQEAGSAKTLMLLSGVAMAGEWDEARLVGDNELDALRGDQLVAIDFAASRGTIGQIAKLADTAILNLDKPMAVNDAAGITEARARTGDLPKERPVCDLVTADDIKAITGKEPAQAPTVDSENCTFHWTSESGLENEITLQVQWRDGFRKFGREQAETSVAGGNLGDVAAAGGEKAATAHGPWDAMAETFVGVMAVKRDVWLNIETGGVDNDTATAFIRAAAGKL